MTHYQPTATPGVIPFTTEVFQICLTLIVYLFIINFGSLQCNRSSRRKYHDETNAGSMGLWILILDSVVSTHDQTDVSRQLIQTLHVSLKNVHGDAIGSHCSSISLNLTNHRLN